MLWSKPQKHQNAKMKTREEGRGKRGASLLLLFVVVLLFTLFFLMLLPPWCTDFSVEQHTMNRYSTT